MAPFPKIQASSAGTFFHKKPAAAVLSDLKRKARAFESKPVVTLATHDSPSANREKIISDVEKGVAQRMCEDAASTASPTMSTVTTSSAGSPISKCESPSQTDICRKPLVICKGEDTFKDRESYRKAVGKIIEGKSCTSKAASAARPQGQPALPDKASASQSIPPGPPRMCPPSPLPAPAATGIRTCISDGPSEPIPPAVTQPIMEPPCPWPAAATTNTMAACISDGSRKRGWDDDKMTFVPTRRLRTLSEALLRCEESSHTMVGHCVQIGHHFQTEAEVLRAARVEIDRLLEDTS